MKKLINFINDNLTFTNNYKISLKYLEIFIKYCEKTEFDLNKDIVFKLLKLNKIFYQIIELLSFENNDKIENNKIMEIINYFYLYKSEHLLNSKLDSSIKQYLGEIPTRILTKEEEIKLFERYKQGDQNAKNEIICHNLKLVISVAFKYNNGEIPLLDLIQEGNLALIRAVEMFDISKGNKFSTYALKSIEHSMIATFYNQKRMIKVPASVVKLLKEIKIYCNEYEEETKRKPSLKDITKKFFITEKRLLEILNIEKDVSFFLDESTPLMEHNLEMVFETEWDIEELYDDIEEYLDEKEKIIIKKYYGICGFKQTTLQDIGKELNISKERVRQINDTALIKLKYKRKKYITDLIKSKKKRGYFYGEKRRINVK